MAIIQLNPVTFTPIPIAEKSLVQFQGGVARMADSATPADGDYASFSNGDMIVLEGPVYARGVGRAIVVAI